MLIPIDFFVDPYTKEKLTLGENYLTNKNKDRYFFDPINKYWNFMPKQNLSSLNREWDIWKKLQDNGESSYNNDPQHNLGVGRRNDFLEFAEFCKFHGTILDIGVGPQKNPTHLKYSKRKDFFFIGLDPLKGAQPKDYSFVQGLGEYLPFRDELFNQVIYVTSLDHFIDPGITLKEARRVLKKKGQICIFMGIKDKKAPKLTTSPLWYKKIKIPEGADDPFHYRKFNCESIEKVFNKLNLTIIEKSINIVDKWRSNIFYKLL